MKTKKDQKIGEMIAAGMEIMLRKGYHGTGVQEIVDTAGVPKGSFYMYFKSKEDFVICAMDHESRKSLAIFDSNLKNMDLIPSKRIIDAFKKAIYADVDKQSPAKGCFVGKMCQEIADTNEKIAEKAEYIFRGYVAKISDCIREGQKDGDISKHYDADRMGEFIFNSWEGTLLRMKSSRNQQPVNAFLEMLDVILK